MLLLNWPVVGNEKDPILQKDESLTVPFLFDMYFIDYYNTHLIYFSQHLLKLGKKLLIVLVYILLILHNHTKAEAFATNLLRNSNLSFLLTS